MREEKSLKIGNILTTILLVLFFLPWARGDFLLEGANAYISFSGYELAHHLMDISAGYPGGTVFAGLLFYLIPLLAIYKLLYDNLVIQRKLTGILLGLYSTFNILFYFSLYDGANFEHIAIGAILTGIMGIVVFLFSVIYQ